MHENHWGKPREVHSGEMSCINTTHWTRAHTSHMEPLPQFTAGVKSHTHPGVVIELSIWFHFTLPLPLPKAHFRKQGPGLLQGEVPRYCSVCVFRNHFIYINYAPVYIRVLSYFYVCRLESFCVLCSCPKGEGCCTILHSTVIFRNTPVT